MAPALYPCISHEQINTNVHGREYWRIHIKETTETQHVQSEQNLKHWFLINKESMFLWFLFCFSVVWFKYNCTDNNSEMTKLVKTQIFCQIIWNIVICIDYLGSQPSRMLWHSFLRVNSMLQSGFTKYNWRLKDTENRFWDKMKTCCFFLVLHDPRRAILHPQLNELFKT